MLFSDNLLSTIILLDDDDEDYMALQLARRGSTQEVRELAVECLRESAATSRAVVRALKMNAMFEEEKAVYEQKKAVSEQEKEVFHQENMISKQGTLIMMQKHAVMEHIIYTQGQQDRKRSLMKELASHVKDTTDSDARASRKKARIRYEAFKESQETVNAGVEEEVDGPDSQESLLAEIWDVEKGIGDGKKHTDNLKRTLAELETELAGLEAELASTKEKYSSKGEENASA